MEEKTSSGEKEIRLLDYLIVVLKRKRLILAGAAGSTLLAFIVCLLLTPTYEGIARLMPPTDSSSAVTSQILAQAGMALGVSSSLFGGDTSGSDLFVGLLQTEAVLDPVIEKFNLMKFYDQPTLEETRKKMLDDVVKVESDAKSRIVSITIGHKDPEQAALICNAFVDELKKLLTRVAITDAGKRRLFFEDQLKTAHENLKNAEESLQGFQESTGAIKMDDQASAILQQIVSLRGLVLSKESQLNVMKTYATANNPDLKRAVSELRTLKEELKRLEQSTEQQSVGDVMIPTAQIPNLGKEYVRRVRDFKLNELLWEMVIKQYESAKMDEARESLLVQVITPAIKGTKPARPKTTLIVIIVAASSLFVFIFVAFMIEFLQRLSSEGSEDSRRLKEIKGLLKKF
jgi:tyrosine-protein kinase Etk/Wzc